MTQRRAAASAALVGLALVLLPPSARAASFDGRWSVEVITESGQCDRAYRYPLAIRGGQISYAGPESFDVSGQVRSGGRVNGAIARGNLRVQVSGRLQGKWGQGTWAGNNGCGGRWIAEQVG